MKRFTVRVFDGENTRVYTTEGTDIYTAENKVLKYHRAFGGKVIKVETTQIR